MELMKEHEEVVKGWEPDLGAASGGLAETKAPRPKSRTQLRIGSSVAALSFQQRARQSRAREVRGS